MGSWKIEFHHAAEKDLRKLPRDLISRVFKAIRALKDDPQPAGSRKLRGREDARRLRIGDYRVLYLLKEKVRIISIERIRHRRDVYR